MQDTQEITLSGFGTLDNDENLPEGQDDRAVIAKKAKEYDLEFYPTYYDHELRGERGKIEALTLDLWAMSRDEWSENALTETEVTSN